LKKETKEYRPWGYYKILYDGEHIKIKQLVVYPEQRLSYQRHSFRSEHWFILDGECKFTLNGNSFNSIKGQSMTINACEWHRVLNTSKKENLIILEIQTGCSFEESDIERMDDDYGRF